MTTLKLNTFYGTQIETYYVDGAGNIWLLQSPDGPITKPLKAEDLPANAEELPREIIDAEMFEQVAGLK